MFSYVSICQVIGWEGWVFYFSQEIGWEYRLWNDLCSVSRSTHYNVYNSVEWDTEPHSAKYLEVVDTVGVIWAT